MQVAAAETTTVPPKPKPAPVPGSDVLRIIDEAGSLHKVGRDEFLKLARQQFKAKTHAGESTFAGVSLVDLLKSVGVRFEAGLRGKGAPTVAICEATDGYRIVVSLLEIDPATADRKMMVVDEQDGKPLGARTGFYRLVIPDDKREIRWIRNLQTIRVVNLADFPLQGSPETETGKQKQ